jgi:hypothetical protein
MLLWVDRSGFASCCEVGGGSGGPTNCCERATPMRPFIFEVEFYSSRTSASYIPRKGNPSTRRRCAKISHARFGCETLGSRGSLWGG